MNNETLQAPHGATDIRFGVVSDLVIAWCRDEAEVMTQAINFTKVGWEIQVLPVA